VKGRAKRSAFSWEPLGGISRREPEVDIDLHGELMDEKRTSEHADQTAQLGEAIRSKYNLERPIPDKLRTLALELDDGGGAHIVKTAVKARGGFLGRSVLTVLIVSTVLIVGAFAIISYVMFG
jgi:hypothetical protein